MGVNGDKLQKEIDEMRQKGDEDEKLKKEKDDLEIKIAKMQPIVDEHPILEEEKKKLQDQADKLKTEIEELKLKLQTEQNEQDKDVDEEIEGTKESKVKKNIAETKDPPADQITNTITEITDKSEKESLDKGNIVKENIVQTQETTKKLCQLEFYKKASFSN